MSEVVVKSDVNKYLYKVLGNNFMVDSWWHTENFHFDLKTPEEVYQSGDANKSSPIDADLDGMERELNVLIDSLAILRQRLNPVLCANFEFEETPGEPMRAGSPISYRLNVFRSCVREATNRIDALRSGLEI